MSIHHATIKKAEKFGVVLAEIETADALLARALWAERNFRIQHTDPKVALAAVRLQQVFAAEWPALTLDHVDGEFIVTTTDPDEPVEVFRSDEVPELADVLDACGDFGINPEEGYDDEVPHVVVPHKYKEEYAERGNRNHCGDWLAGFLDGRFSDTEGRFNADEFAQFLQANGVDMGGKWAGLPTSGQKGWVGRYRMNGRQKLEVRVAATGGVTLLDGTFMKAPLEYLEELIARHPCVSPEWVDD